MKETDLRTVRLIGEDGLRRLSRAAVAVFGVGGVGSYAAEALCRSGVGTLHLYDHDVVSESNCNRQLIADSSTVGRGKTEIAAERCRLIRPEITAIGHPVFVTPESQIPFSEFDCIIDAVDNVTAKIFLITSADKAGVPVISVMGTGNKLDPTQLQVGDLYDTRECPLARVMRTELKKRGIKKLRTVWSPEHPITPADHGEQRSTGRTVPGSMVFVPACAGMIAAAEAVKLLLTGNDIQYGNEDEK